MYYLNASNPCQNLLVCTNFNLTKACRIYGNHIINSVQQNCVVLESSISVLPISLNSFCLCSLSYSLTLRNGVKSEVSIDIYGIISHLPLNFTFLGLWFSLDLAVHQTVATLARSCLFGMPIYLAVQGTCIYFKSFNQLISSLASMILKYH